MRKLFLTAVMGASVLAGVPAIAQTPPPPAASGLNGAGPADANRDGIVTRAEATAEAERRFSATDANRDGTVTKDELRTERERHHAERVARRGTTPPPGADMAKHHGMKHGKHAGMGKRLDTDRDGTATRAEWLKRSDDRFARVDTNKDGRIDAAERTAKREQRRMHRAGQTPPPPPPAG